MKSNPYLGIDENIESLVKPLLRGADAYHSTHEARLARTAHILEAMLSVADEDCRVLELGTSGFLPVVVNSLFPSVGIDVTDFDSAVQAGGGSTEKVRLVGIAGREVEVTAFTVDLEYDDIPVLDETYDFVVCCEVLEHMEIDPMFMLSEVNRVLKTGGQLLLTTPNVLSSRGITKMLSGHEPYFFMQYHRNREYHRHNYEYSVKQVWSILSCAGFDATVWTEDLFEDSLPHCVESLKYAGFPIDHVGDNIIAVATKVSGVIERYPHGLYV